MIRFPAVTAALILTIGGAPRLAAGQFACSLERISQSYSGPEANWDSTTPSSSASGRYVAFSSLASNLVPGDTNAVGDIFVVDRVTLRTERVSIGKSGSESNGHSGYNAISTDGQVVAFGSLASNLDPRDTDPISDIYVHDRATGATTLVSERVGTGASLQGCYRLSISADGRFVAFECIDNNVPAT